MKPVVLKAMEENLNALSRQLHSQLRISHENLVKFHKSYENTTDYEAQDPVVCPTTLSYGWLLFAHSHSESQSVLYCIDLLPPTGA